MVETHTGLPDANTILQILAHCVTTSVTFSLLAWMSPIVSAALGQSQEILGFENVSTPLLPTGIASTELATAMRSIRDLAPITYELKIGDGFKLRWSGAASIFRERPRTRCKAKFEIAVADPDGGEA